MSLACVACSRPGAAWRRLSGGDEFHAVCGSQQCLAQLVGGAHEGAKRQQLEIDLTYDIDGNDDSDSDSDALLDTIAANTAANESLAALDACADVYALASVARGVPYAQWVLLYGTTGWFRRVLDTPDVRPLVIAEPSAELDGVAASAEATGLYALADHIYQLSVPGLAQRGADYFGNHPYEAIRATAARSDTALANHMLRLAIASEQPAALVASILAARTADPLRAEPRPSPFDAAVRAGRIDLVPEFIEYNRAFRNAPTADWARWTVLAQLSGRHAMELLIMRAAADVSLV